MNVQRPLFLNMNDMDRILEMNFVFLNDQGPVVQLNELVKRADNKIELILSEWSTRCSKVL